MGADYYYTRAGQRFGPVPAEQLKSMAASGQLLLDDMVWKEGMATSIAAARLKGLFPAAALNPAPQQPVVVPEQPHEFRVADLPPPKPSPAATEVPHAEPVQYKSPLDEDSQADIMARKAKEAAFSAGTDAWVAFKIMMGNPVGGLKAAFESLGGTRAKAAGIVFGVIFDICVVLGVRLLAGSAGFLWRSRAASESFPFSLAIKLFAIGIVILAIVVAVSASLRKIFHGIGSIDSDIFLAGASMLPIGVALVLGGVLGYANSEIILVVMVFACSTTVLMLYSGFTKMHSIPETASSIAVPLVLLFSAYSWKVILVM
jgi:hypothetical protein